MSFGYGIGDVIALAQLSWSVYTSCKDAPVSFQNVSQEVLSLHTVLKEVEANLSGSDLTPQQQTGLRTVSDGCHSVLQELKGLVTKYENLGTQRKALWVRLRWGAKDIAEIRLRLISNTNLLTAYLSSSQVLLEKKLKEFIGDYQAGKVVPSAGEEAQVAKTYGEQEEWLSLSRQLQGIGITASVFQANKALIFKWMKDALPTDSVEDEILDDGASAYYSIEGSDEGNNEPEGINEPEEANNPWCAVQETSDGVDQFMSAKPYLGEARRLMPKDNQEYKMPADIYDESPQEESGRGSRKYTDTIRTAKSYSDDTSRSGNKDHSLPAPLPETSIITQITIIILFGSEVFRLLEGRDDYMKNKETLIPHIVDEFTAILEGLQGLQALLIEDSKNADIKILSEQGLEETALLVQRCKIKLRRLCVLVGELGNKIETFAKVDEYLVDLSGTTKTETPAPRLDFKLASAKYMARPRSLSRTRAYLTTLDALKKSLLLMLAVSHLAENMRFSSKQETTSAGDGSHTGDDAYAKVADLISAQRRQAAQARHDLRGKVDENNQQR